MKKDYIKVIVFVLMGLFLASFVYSGISLTTSIITLIRTVGVVDNKKGIAIPVLLFLINIVVVVFLFIISNRVILKEKAMDDKNKTAVQIILYIIISGFSVYLLVNGAQYLSNPSPVSIVLVSLIHSFIRGVLIIFWSFIVLHSSYTVKQKEMILP